MLSTAKKTYTKVRNWFSKPLEFFTARGNTLIIQAYPKKSVLYVSYKGQVRTAYFHDETMVHMLKCNHDFKKHTDRFLSAVGQLIQQITINK